MSNTTKVVVVTGVSSGIGRATAEMFFKQGCEVFGTVRNIKKAQSIPGVELVEMDICDETSIQRGIEFIIAKANRIDVLVNSAGVTLLGATEETSVTEAQALFDTNVWGILRTIQAVLPNGLVALSTSVRCWGFFLRLIWDYIRLLNMLLKGSLSP